MPRHPIDQIEVLRRLRRHQPEAGECRGKRGIDIVRPDGTIRRAALAVGRIDRRVDDHRARQPLAIERAGQDGDEAAEAVADDDRRLGRHEHAGILADRDLLVREQLHRIAVRPPVAVAHAGKIDGGDVVVARQHRCDEIPPMGMRGVAVHQQQPRLRAIAPALVMDARAFDLDEAVFGFLRDGFREPFRRWRRRTGKRRERPLVLVDDEHLGLRAFDRRNGRKVVYRLVMRATRSRCHADGRWREGARLACRHDSG